ncbi:class I SAM-dependent methyltransferase [Agrobacterium tumefaciens]|uniref:Methyltransferase type 11 domain-containing protein n=1 Tax=Agrobacterium tumefaciens TaxID=358 RepID=A0A2L2LBT5_AGRTU|nr:class I SAM-dependent methyltransferase [Agrobacterium tumefaciens]AVH41804.1 hypothetical protein At1D1609_17500 [Agrobacterium tumefaciens]NSY95724.1 class I SAM-dependent methyltransferase [Agrobacterium tumefaciens]
MGVVFSQQAGDELVANFGAGVDDEAYRELTTIRYSHPLVEDLNKLHPFSAEYRKLAMHVYNDLRGDVGRTYDPERDEASGIVADVADINTMASPWNFKNPNLISEFLHSWGQIFRHLDIKAGQSVLEYGTGSGQTLLMLARAGIDCYGVDIDTSSLSILQRQARDLGVKVSTEQASFGEGFATHRFDRVLFFESFHHAFDFENLLLRLHDRILPGGKVVFCGEPVIQGVDSSIPYPWGPRLDALSVYCTRARGWMELGFQHDTFVDLLWRCGWKVSFHPFPTCGRAHVYVAEPAWSGVSMFEPVELGRHAGTWHPAENGHRWSKARSLLSLPVGVPGGLNVEVKLSNYLGSKKSVRLSSGTAMVEFTMAPGERDRVVAIHRCDGEELVIECNTDSTPTDPRKLGVAVHHISLSE